MATKVFVKPEDFWVCYDMFCSRIMIANVGNLDFFLSFKLFSPVALDTWITQSH